MSGEKQQKREQRKKAKKRKYVPVSHPETEEEVPYNIQFNTTKIPTIEKIRKKYF